MNRIEFGHSVRMFVLSLGILLLSSCGNMFRDELSEIHNEIDDLKLRLEQLCEEVNTNISALQIIVTALENNDYVTSIDPVSEGGVIIGYDICFSKSGKITIYHGEDGKDGEDGADGQDGKDGQDGEDGKDGKDGEDGKDGQDGYTPVIGVKMADDGLYYWTLDGDWLLDINGDKVRAVGLDGQKGDKGEPGDKGDKGDKGDTGDKGDQGDPGEKGDKGDQGEPGVTPVLKIEDGYWYISYDNEQSWQQLGRATGENGEDGEDGASFFKEVTYDSDNVYITFVDGQMVVLPLNPSSSTASVSSVVYVPSYEDGKARVLYDIDGFKKMNLSYIVTPRSIVSELATDYENTLTVIVQETLTKSLSQTEFKITSCKADPETGKLDLKLSADELPEGFISNDIGLSVCLIVSYGDSEFACPFVPLTPVVPEENNRYIVYVANTYDRVIESGGNIRWLYDVSKFPSYAPRNAPGASSIEIKFQLNYTRDFDYPLTSQGDGGLGANALRVTDTGIYYQTVSFSKETKYGSTWEEMGLSGPNEKVHLYISFKDRLFRVNGKNVEFKFGNVTGLRTDHFFVDYYYDQDEGDVEKEYYGIADGAKLYHVNTWDADGNILYSGYASQYYDESDGSYEYCWAWKYGEDSGNIFSYRNPNGFEEFGGGVD